MKITTEKDTQNVPHQASQVVIVIKILPANAGDVRDWGSREAGEGIGMGDTWKSMADSCRCTAKTTTVL